jgi:hypothetical protein
VAAAVEVKEEAAVQEAMEEVPLSLSLGKGSTV